jgi:Flp pilus assembly protein TadD
VFLERRPDHLVARTARGDLRVRRGELGLGIADYDVVLAAKDDLPLRLKRAHALSRYGNAAGSDADFEHVAALGDPALFERALVERVLLRSDRGDFAGALIDAERLVSAAPGNPDLHLLRAVLLHRRGEGEAAAEAARSVLRLAAPGSKAATNAQDLLRRLGQRP